VGFLAAVVGKIFDGRALVRFRLLATPETSVHGGCYFWLHVIHVSMYLRFSIGILTARKKMSVFLKKEVARGGERTQVLLISFIFSFFTTLPLSHSGSPKR
jgi:hypothetical protein